MLAEPDRHLHRINSPLSRRSVIAEASLFIRGILLPPSSDCWAGMIDVRGPDPAPGTYRHGPDINSDKNGLGRSSHIRIPRYGRADTVTTQPCRSFYSCPERTSVPALRTPDME